MEHGTKRSARRRESWMARLVQAQLAMRGVAAHVESSPAGDRWPARLIHAGAVLMGVSGAVLATWLRRRL